MSAWVVAGCVPALIVMIVIKPQLDAYVQRALNPDEAPSYGVPGDEWLFNSVVGINATR